MSVSDVSRSLQSWVSTIQLKKLKNVSCCEYDRLNGWNSTLQAAWYVRRSYNMVFVDYTYDMIINTQFYTKYRSRVFYQVPGMFCPYEGYRSVTPLDARVNMTIFHNHSVHIHVCEFFIKSWKTSAVKTTVWMVETQLCKLRGTTTVNFL